MVSFKELRITPDGQTLIIDVESSVDGVKIEQIWVDKSIPAYMGNCPKQTENAILVASVQDPLYQDDIDTFSPAIIPTESQTHVRLELGEDALKDIDLNTALCHIYVVTSGVEPSECQCNPIVKTVANFYPLYQQSLVYIKEVADECSTKQPFADFILKIKGLEIAIKVGNYQLAHYLWESLMKLRAQPKSCNCSNYGVIF